MPDSPRTPWWFTLLLIIVSAATLFFCSQASQVLSAAGWLAPDFTAWFYPAYVVIAAVCSWICFPTRRTLAWILFALIVLSDVALFFTV